MEISSLTKNGNNVEILTDDGTEFEIRYEIVVKNGLKKGDELTEEKIGLLQIENEKFAIRETSFRLLSRRIHSEKELKQKLSRKYFHKQIIDETIESLKQGQYLDDKDFAEKFTEEKIRRKKLGLDKIKSQLILKGISGEIIKECISSHQSTELLKENALNLAAKKIQSLQKRNVETKKIKQRLYSYLASKGYTYEEILDVFAQSNVE
ncbi:MAG: regulatory protein RecX [bacterium]